MEKIGRGFGYLLLVGEVTILLTPAKEKKQVPHGIVLDVLYRNYIPDG